MVRRISNTRRRFDTVSKTLIYQNPKDWAEFSLGITGVEVIQMVETEQPTVQANRADSFIHVNIGGKEGIVHLEMQTHDSTEIPMPYRMAGYIGRAVEFFQLPVYSHVIYLHPRAGRNDPGKYTQEVPEYDIHIPYKVIRLPDLEGSPLLEAGVKGLIPFTPLMKPPAGMESEDWLRRCVEVADAVSVDPVLKADYLTDLAILGGLIFDYPTIREIIMEAIMQESSVIQHFLQQGLEQGIEQGLEQGIEQGLEQGIEQGLEQGIEQGTRKSLIEGILENLEVRFNSPNLQAIASTLEQIEALQHLKQLRRASVQAPDLDAFEQVLNLNGDADEM